MTHLLTPHVTFTLVQRSLPQTAIMKQPRGPEDHPDESSSDESDVQMVEPELQVTPEEKAGSIPGSAEATTAALLTHRRAESFSIDPYRRGPPKPQRQSRDRQKKATAETHVSLNPARKPSPYPPSPPADDREVPPPPPSDAEAAEEGRATVKFPTACQKCDRPHPEGFPCYKKK